ncbi:MAG: Nif3-like dinuclear metal center hexameric protein [Phycisphaerae bacterium]
MARRARGRATVDVARLCGALGRIAPLRLAADWDNVGLLVGDGGWRCGRALVTGDLTPAVLAEAVSARCDAVVAYHPPIFKAQKRMVPGDWNAEDVAAEALSRHIAVYAVHTAWDAAVGGANDAICDLVGVRERRPFSAAGGASGHKLVVFVPQANLEAVADGLFAAGAGYIGDYSHCSFRIPGQGTFWGGAGSSPRIGKRGRLERVAEVRLEVVVPAARLAAVVAALRRVHPYEEPAFDVYPRVSPGEPGAGPGRIGRLLRDLSLRGLAASLKRATRAANVAIVGDAARRIERVFVCVGSAGLLPWMCATICRAARRVLSPASCVITTR